MKKKVPTPPPNPPGDLLNEREAAFYLKQKPRTLRLWRMTRGLPFCRVSSKVVIYRKVDIDCWLSQRRVAITA